MNNPDGLSTVAGRPVTLTPVGMETEGGITGSREDGPGVALFMKSAFLFVLLALRTFCLIIHNGYPRDLNKEELVL